MTHGRNPTPPPDAEAFREAVRDVRPLPANGRVVDRRVPPARARFRRLDERRVLEESLELGPGEVLIDNGDELAFRRAHVPAAVIRRLRRGEIAVREELDLHGLNEAEARAAVRAFLTDALRARLGCVRIVHGKGLRSGPRGPVLKHAVNLWLRKVDAVLAFASAPPRDGGTGALYVLLDR